MLFKEIVNWSQWRQLKANSYFCFPFMLRRGCRPKLFVSAAESSTLTMAKSTQLPALVERSQALLDENRKQLKQIRSMREKQFWRYFHVSEHISFSWTEQFSWDPSLFNDCRYLYIFNVMILSLNKVMFCFTDPVRVAEHFGQNGKHISLRQAIPVHLYHSRLAGSTLWCYVF